MSLKVGIFEAKVLGFNPDRYKLEELTGNPIRKEIQYIKNGLITIVAVLQDVHSEFIAFVKFELKNKPAQSSRGKYTFVNQAGDITWAESEEKIPAYFFKSGDVRSVYEGEEGLIELLKVWRGKSEDSFEYDVSRILKADTGEIRKFGDPNNTIGIMATVKNSLTSKSIQTYYTKKIIPGSEVNHFRTDYAKPYIKKLIETENNKKQYPAYVRHTTPEWQKLLYSMNNPNFPCTDYFVNGYIRDYQPNLNPIESNKAILK